MGYGLARARGSRSEQLGFTNANKTSVTSGATAGTFGTLTSIGTTGFTYDSLILSFASPSPRRGLITLTANTGGADETIADSIPFDQEGGTLQGLYNCGLPIRVPSGATIKAKVATQSAGSSVVQIVVTGNASQAVARGFSQIVSCTDLTSSDPTNTITLTGATVTGWVTVQASTTRPIGWLWACPLSLASLVLGTSGQAYIEIGWGAASSERALFKAPLTANTTFNAQTIGIPCNLPKGTRIAARALANAATTATIGVNCYGAVP